MYGCWTEYAVLKKIFLGFIWDILNISTMYKYWVWVQSRRSKSWIWMGTFSESAFLKWLNNDEKWSKNSKVNLLDG